MNDKKEDQASSLVITLLITIAHQDQSASVIWESGHE